MDAAGTNKSITRQELQTYNAGTLTTDVKVLDLSATWNDAGVTFTGLKFNATDTTSAAGSLLLDLQTGAASRFKVSKTGVLTLTIDNTGGDPTIVFEQNGSSSCRMVTSSAFSVYAGTTSGSNSLDLFASAVNIAQAYLSLSASGGTRLYSDASHIVAQRSATSAQTLRIYNTFTDASNYERLGITWGSNIVTLKPEAAGTGTVRVLHISGLPTSNPGAGILWNNAGTPAIGT